MSGEVQTRTERWTCAGVRVFNGKRRMAWLTEKGHRFRYFDDKGTWVTGGVYEATVSDTEDGHIIRHGDPRYIDRCQDDDLVRRYRAEEIAALAELEAASRARSAAKVNAMDDALAPLIKIAKGLRTQQQRDAFTAHVINRVSQAWWTR